MADARAGLLACLAASIGLSACATYRGIGHRVGFDAPGPATAPIEAVPDRPVDDPPSAHLESHFDWPVNDARVSRGFKAARRAHWGLDLANKRGTHVVASDKGHVIYAGRGFHGYGKLVVVEHEGDWATLYAHLDRFAVKEGDVVQQGQLIGLMGRTGHASGVHLHFEIRHDRIPVDPMLYLPKGF